MNEKRTNVSIAIILPGVVPGCYARTGGQRNIIWDHRLLTAVCPRACGGTPVSLLAVSVGPVLRASTSQFPVLCDGTLYSIDLPSGQHTPRVWLKGAFQGQVDRGSLSQDFLFLWPSGIYYRFDGPEGCRHISYGAYVSADFGERQLFRPVSPDRDGGVQLEFQGVLGVGEREYGSVAGGPVDESNGHDAGCGHGFSLLGKSKGTGAIACPFSSGARWLCNVSAGSRVSSLSLCSNGLGQGVLTRPWSVLVSGRGPAFAGSYLPL